MILRGYALGPLRAPRASPLKKVRQARPAMPPATRAFSTSRHAASIRGART